MAFLRRLRSFLPGKKRGDRERRTKHHTTRMAKATESLDEMRGDRISPQSGDHRASSMENLNAAVKDYGLSRFSGETDAIAGAKKSYRPAKSRRQHKREGS